MARLGAVVLPAHCCIYMYIKKITRGIRGRGGMTELVYWRKDVARHGAIGLNSRCCQSKLFFLALCTARSRLASQNYFLFVTCKVIYSPCIVIC